VADAMRRMRACRDPANRDGDSGDHDGVAVCEYSAIVGRGGREAVHRALVNRLSNITSRKRRAAP